MSKIGEGRAVEPKTFDLRLLLNCAKARTSEQDDADICRVLEDGIDWSAFVRKVVDHGLISLVGHTLLRTAPHAVPDDIRNAFQASLERTRANNQAMFEELSRVIDELRKVGVEAIPFKGPILAILAYGDLGLRVFRDLDFLIRDRDVDSTMATLARLGYVRREALSPTQIEMIQRIQGQENVFKRSDGTVVEPHTRLIPNKMALDIDYDGIWQRSQHHELNGQRMRILAPEDDFIVLAVHGGKEVWRQIKWACDMAAFIRSHPTLDWREILRRAQAQGCLRMVLTATSLVRNSFGSDIPDAIVAAERAHPGIASIVARIQARWQNGRSIRPPSNSALSMERLRLHDGLPRRARYVARTLLLPGPRHVAGMRLSKRLGFAYIPFRVTHDLVALPLWRACRQGFAQASQLRNAIARSHLAMAVIPASSEVMGYRDAYRAATRALRVDPNNPAAWNQRADALSGLRHFDQAITAYDKVLALVPDDRAAWRRRSDAFRAMGKAPDLPPFLRDPKDAATWTMRAGALSALRHFGEAVESSDRAIELDPENMAAVRIGMHCRLHSCDWRRREEDERRISEGFNAGSGGVLVSSDHFSLCDSEAENRLAAESVAKRFSTSATPLWRGQRYDHEKIRIAYISADLHVHATGFLIAGVFDHHDKSRFETTAISLGRDDNSEMRRRIESAFDRFIDVQRISDFDAAKIIRELEIDIAIDLKGYTAGMRTAILAHRPAPVQVNYLGHPATMAVPFIDYIIADRVVIPPENRIHFSEKVVYLPYSYQPNDSKRPLPDCRPSRIEAGQPEAGFVFTCLNNSFKISPEIFDIWMRLLRTVENSIFWLLEDNVSASLNLRREATVRGVAPERLVFAPRLPQSEHVARQRLADLFLDTLPCNAHTTASDALWAGLPVLTCVGNTFPGRVGASLLYAIGLPELVTTSLAEYEALALALASDPDRLATIREKLMRNRLTEPLFDTVRYTRDLEAAYETMWERTQRGERAESFAISADRASSP
jgi:protein O-GlcNAc transferase